MTEVLEQKVAKEIAVDTYYNILRYTKLTKILIKLVLNKKCKTN